MTINYKGMDREYPYRIAEIEININKNEEELLDRLVFWLEQVHGYKVDVVTDGVAYIEVENYTEYKELVSIYKAGKKMIQNCIKFGF